jgi:CubicO group peptidase (beta-lactamase class C family)
MRPSQRHFMTSVTKVFISALVGILEQAGLLDLSAPVDTVITELAGTGWAGVPARDVLGMASGIGCLDDNSPARAPILTIRSTGSRPRWGQVLQSTGHGWTQWSAGLVTQPGSVSRSQVAAAVPS